jgi:hypothetical protein
MVSWGTMRGVRIAAVVGMIGVISIGSHDALHAAPTKGSGPSSTSSPATAAQPASSPSNTGPFESQMLAYGALDEVTRTIANRTCHEYHAAPPGRIVVLDQASLTSLAAYDSFDAITRHLARSYQALNVQQPAPGAGGGGGGVDLMADIVSAVSAVLIASNTETASSITIQDSSAALKLVLYLGANSECAQAQITYASASPPNERMVAITNILNAVSNARSDALQNLVPNGKAGFDALDQTYNSFIQSLVSASSTGQPLLASIIQGYGIRQALRAPGTVFSVFVNVATAGGTQQVRKNALTALVTGDWIRYSGGIVINTMIMRYDTGAILFSDVLRYRSPLTKIRKPLHEKSTRYGDNLGDTCAPGVGSCNP